MIARADSDKSAHGAATAALAAFVRGTQWDGIPPTVRHEAKRALLNYFAVALGGCADPTVEAAARVMRRFSAGSAASVVGRAERFDILNAASLNAMAANVFDFDDTHTPTIMHPTAPVAPAVCALAQTRSLAGSDFLLAFIVGIETGCRIGVAVSPTHYSRGWHITSTCGIFGATAASARVLGLSEQEIGWAFASASAQASGMVEMLGTSAKSIGVGNAARNGLVSALLAQEGFEGPLAPLEGERGFLRVYCEQPRVERLKGSEYGWELLRNAYKPYPCGVVLFPVIDACLLLAEQPDFRQRALDDIVGIEITAHSLLRQRTDRPDITTGRQSQVSAQHAVGIALRRRRATLEEFSDAAVREAAVRALGARVRFIDDDAMSVDAARVRIDFADGGVFKEQVQHARGSVGNPLSDADLEQKLRDLCAYGKSGVDPSKLIDAVWALDRCADVANVLELASPA